MFAMKYFQIKLHSRLYRSSLKWGTTRIYPHKLTVLNVYKRISKVELTKKHATMKQLTTYLILAATIAGLIWLNLHQRSELTRTRANWRAEVQDLIRQQDVTQRELVQMYDITERLQQELNIKPKQIVQYIRVPVQYRDTGSVKINTVHDTVKVYPDSISGLIKRPCYDLSILLYRGEFVTQMSYKDTTEVVLYRTRPHRFWFIRYGKWQHQAALISACRDTIYRPVRNIKVIR